MKIVGERKAAAARLAELTGERAVYTKMPRCAYEVGPYAIERDGSVTASESADLAPLRTLAQEGLLEGWAEQTDDTTETSQEAATEAENDAPDANDTPDAEGVPGAVTEAPTLPQIDTLTISVPLAGHTANSLRNLVSLVYSRGQLLSKATGGNFGCTLDQVNALKDCLTIFDAVARITDILTALTISDEKIIFTFPATDDAEKIKAFTQLVTQMNKAAKAQKRVMAKVTDAANEKYIFRIWLLALGMGGDEFKTARRVLLQPLTGSAAFKDQAMQDRWKEKQAEKRNALRVAKEVSADEISE